MDAIILTYKRNGRQVVEPHDMMLPTALGANPFRIMTKLMQRLLHTAKQGETIDGVTFFTGNISDEWAARKVAILLCRGHVRICWQDIDTFMSMCHKLNVPVHGGAFVLGDKEVTGQYFYI